MPPHFTPKRPGLADLQAPPPRAGRAVESGLAAGEITASRHRPSRAPDRQNSSVDSEAVAGPSGPELLDLRPWEWLPAAAAAPSGSTAPPWSSAVV